MNHNISPPPDAAQSAHSREVLIELVGLHARILRRMPLVQTILALGVSLFVLPHIALPVFAGWCAASVGIEALRARYAGRVMRSTETVDPVRAHSLFVLWALAAGGVVGLGAALAFPSLPMTSQALLGGILFAMPAAGVAVSQSSRYIVAAYSLSMLVPASVSWMLLHPDQAVALGVLTLLYCGLIILVAVEGDQLLLRSVVIRHERDRLVRDLELRNADVRAAMERAETAAQSRARVLATASHDLRQPLHALSLYSAVLAAKPEPAQLREVGANIDQIVRSLGSLLHGLLDLSRLTAGHFVPERERVALDVTVAAICAEYARTAAQKNLTLTTDLATVHLLGDAVAIGRIVRNLVDNAVKYTDDGSVRVSLCVEGDAAIVSVEDSGPGIPAAEQSRVFEEFYQLDNPGRDRSRGVGLGLAIVKRLCELIGADIVVESVVCKGTTFRLRMPGVLVEPIGDSASVDPETKHVDLRGYGVYLVDDEPDVLNSTRHLLRTWGMRVELADSAAAAESVFAARGAPELLITDLRLRGKENGATLAERMRNRYGYFPIVVITGEVSAAATRQVEQLGATLLYKPLTAETLRVAIGKSLSGGRFTAGPRSNERLAVQP
jgi:two-component system, sensor histidine kinase